MSGISLKWLGQSGFLLKSPETVIACDLYLSDYCVKMSKLDHTRLMAAPVAADSLDYIDHYLITHGHIDHFDPETVGPVLEAGEQTKFYCPPVCGSIVREHFQLNSDRFSLVNSLQEYQLASGVTLIPVPAAHEELEKDENGEYISYSYLVLFEAEKTAVFFGGDTIPYPGQDKNISEQLPEGFKLVMVLPVNGRDEERATLGFKGNFTLDEAVELCHKVHANLLVPCHYGMFALNDIREPMSQEVFASKDCPAEIPEPMKEITI